MSRPARCGDDHRSQPGSRCRCNPCAKQRPADGENDADRLDKARRPEREAIAAKFQQIGAGDGLGASGDRGRNRSADRMTVIRHHAPTEDVGTMLIAYGQPDNHDSAACGDVGQPNDIACRLQHPHDERRDVCGEPQLHLLHRFREGGAVHGFAGLKQCVGERTAVHCADQKAPEQNKDVPHRRGVKGRRRRQRPSAARRRSQDDHRAASSTPRPTHELRRFEPNLDRSCQRRSRCRLPAVRLSSVA
jgi:hypothetical protein